MSSMQEQMQELVWKQFKSGQISEEQAVSALLKEGGLTDFGAREVLRHTLSPEARRAGKRDGKEFN